MYISKIDADSVFWTLPLDLSSQLLTTFDTPWERFYGSDCVSLSTFSNTLWTQISRISPKPTS